MTSLEAHWMASLDSGWREMLPRPKWYSVARGCPRPLARYIKFGIPGSQSRLGREQDIKLGLIDQAPHVCLAVDTICPLGNPVSDHVALKTISTITSANMARTYRSRVIYGSKHSSFDWRWAQILIYGEKCPNPGTT